MTYICTRNTAKDFLDDEAEEASTDESEDTCWEHESRDEEDDTVIAAVGLDEDGDKPKQDDECQICHYSGKPARTLLCDGPGCDKPYHMACLSPPKRVIPKGNCCTYWGGGILQHILGDWYCPSCVAIQNFIPDDDTDIFMN